MTEKFPAPQPVPPNVVDSTPEDRDAAIRMWHKHCDPFKSWMGETPPSPVIDAMLAFAQASATVMTPLTDAQIEAGRVSTFSTNNPFCPCDSKTMLKAVRWAERAHRIAAVDPLARFGFEVVINKTIPAGVIRLYQDGKFVGEVKNIKEPS